MTLIGTSTNNAAAILMMPIVLGSPPAPHSCGTGRVQLGF